MQLDHGLCYAVVNVSSTHAVQNYMYVSRLKTLRSIFYEASLIRNPLIRNLAIRTDFELKFSLSSFHEKYLLMHMFCFRCEFSKAYCENSSLVSKDISFCTGA